MKSKEIRNIVVTELETRAEADMNVIEGYIVKYNQNSEYMGFFETVDPNAFINSLATNEFIPMLYSHEMDKIMGSTRSGSLKLMSDAIGLRFSLQVNTNISYAKDTYELVKSGDIKSCSFGFNCIEDNWGYTTEGVDLRTLLEVDLIEVSLVPFPAYSQSRAEARCASFDTYKAEEVRKSKEENLKKRLLIELDL